MKKDSAIYALVLLFAMNLCGCQRLYLRNGLTGHGYPLLKPEQYIEPAACWQKLSVISADTTTHFQSVYDATSEIHRLVLMSPLGQRLATVEQSRGRISSVKTMPMSLVFPPGELFLAMQLIYWPKNLLEDNFKTAGWRIIDKENHRYIYKEDDLLVQIMYQGPRGCEGGLRYSLKGEYELILEGFPF